MCQRFYIYGLVHLLQELPLRPHSLPLPLKLILFVSDRINLSPESLRIALWRSLNVPLQLQGLKRFQELVAMRESDSLNISMTVYHFLQPSNAYARLRRLDSEQQDQPRGAQSNNYILDFSSDKRLQTVLRQVTTFTLRVENTIVCHIN